MKSPAARNLYLTLLIFVILGGAFWWWFSGSSDKAPDPMALVNNTANEAKEKAVKLTMQTAAMSITDIDADRIKVANKVIIKNPLPVPLSASRYDYAVLMNGVKVAEGTYDKAIHIPAAGSKTITLPMQVKIKPMESVTDKMNAAGNDSATYTFLNTIYTDVPIAGERKFNINLKEELPVVRLLKMRPGDIDIDKWRLKNTGLTMTMHITNPNAFSIRMKDGRYAMTIDGKTTLDGEMQEVVNLPAKATTPVTMHMNTKTGRALKMGWKMLFDNKDTRYTLTFDSKILSEPKLLQNSTMHFNEAGNLQELKEAVKAAKN